MLQKQSEKRPLPVKLTERERLDLGEKLAETVDEITKLEAQKAAEVKRLGDLIKAERETQAKLALAIETGEEFRKIRCEWVADMAAKEWSVHRTDTGEVIQRQTMTAEELQMSLHAVS